MSSRAIALALTAVLALSGCALLLGIETGEDATSTSSSTQGGGGSGASTSGGMGGTAGMGGFPGVGGTGGCGDGGAPVPTCGLLNDFVDAFDGPADVEWRVQDGPPLSTQSFENGAWELNALGGVAATATRPVASRSPHTLRSHSISST